MQVLSSDLVADLRAEVSRWWECLQRQQRAQRDATKGAVTSSDGSIMTSSATALRTPVLGGMLNDGPIRMITLGQELTVDLDEKCLSEMQFKDRQVHRLANFNFTM